MNGRHLTRQLLTNLRTSSLQATAHQHHHPQPCMQIHTNPARNTCTLSSTAAASAWLLLPDLWRRTFSSLLSNSTSSSSSSLTNNNQVQLIQRAHYKVKTSLALRCEHCYFVRRKGKLRVLCKENGRHKQKQM